MAGKRHFYDQPINVVVMGETMLLVAPTTGPTETVGAITELCTTIGAAGAA